MGTSAAPTPIPAPAPAPAPTTPPAPTYQWYQSRTVWASLLGAGLAYLQNPTPIGIAQAVAIALAGFGVRGAIAANGTGQ